MRLEFDKVETDENGEYLLIRIYKQEVSDENAIWNHYNNCNRVQFNPNDDLQQRAKLKKKEWLELRNKMYPS